MIVIFNAQSFQIAVLPLNDKAAWFNYLYKTKNMNMYYSLFCFAVVNNAAA